HVVRIEDVQRMAVAVLQEVVTAGVVVDVFQPLQQCILLFLVAVQRDVAEAGNRQFRAELLLVFGIGELEEGQGAAVLQAEETMAVNPFLAEQFGFLAPGRHQRHADDVFVEGAGPFQVLRYVSVVVQAFRNDFHVRTSGDVWQLLAQASPSSWLTMAVPWASACSLARADSRGRYFRPQSGAAMRRS